MADDCWLLSGTLLRKMLADSDASKEIGTARMKKVALYSILLVLGLVLSQVLPPLIGPGYKERAGFPIHFLTQTALAFIMIHVGFEFIIDKRRLGGYLWDYVVAMTAAALPWIFCVLYFVYAMVPSELWTHPYLWKEAALIGRFASPTSAGILFSMLAAAGLAGTWVFNKARILAIFDDLDTILLMIPLQILLIGFQAPLLVMVGLLGILLWIGYTFLHRIPLRHEYPWVLLYAFGLAVVCEAFHYGSVLFTDPGSAPIHLEVLLPAFVLGCVTRQAPHDPDAPTDKREEYAGMTVSAVFMLLAGMSMPMITVEEIGGESPIGYRGVPEAILAAKNHFPGWDILIGHVAALFVLSNLGKMFPLICYRTKSLRERLALCVSLFPRGEVGTGVLVISLSYKVAGPVVAAAMLTLCANLVCTGLFIVVVKALLRAETIAAILKKYVSQSVGLDYAVYLPRFSSSLQGMPAGRRSSIAEKDDRVHEWDRAILEVQEVPPDRRSSRAAEKGLLYAPVGRYGGVFAAPRRDAIGDDEAGHAIQSAADLVAARVGVSIKRTLDECVTRGGGLDYVVYLERDGDRPGQVLEANSATRNPANLEKALREQALTHSVVRQKELWNDAIGAVHDSFMRIQRLPDSDGKPVKMSRLVLDVEIGGLLYAAVGEHGWVFAATLSQKSMNDSRAEADLVDVVADLARILDEPQ